MTTPAFPPLFEGMPATGQKTPFAQACDAAKKGCDAGLVTYDLGAHQLSAAIVFAPETRLDDALAILPLCGVGFQNALGALAPPEVAVHLDWDGTIRVNGGRCGILQIAASTLDPDHEPDWIVVALTLQLWPDDPETGHIPDHTALYAEGCADVDAVALLEAWIRHTLVWINRWDDEGAAPIHKEWTGIAYQINEKTTVDGRSGIFLGVDEKFGLLLRDDDNTTLIPLTNLLKDN